MDVLVAVALFMLLAASGAHAQAEAQQRTPQFPLKDKRCLLSDAQINLARKNIEIYGPAKEIADGIIKAANPWLEWPDQRLRDAIASAQVPRAFNVCTMGCPKCGKAIYEKGGTYPWIIDLDRPFKVKCPICGSVFPDNDFEAYYRSGSKDKQYLEGEYADDGWGWHGPNDRYWFVAYANHWTWLNHLQPALDNLGKAYVITSDPRYAHKAVIMLDRVAEVYPAMDYHNQSRYGFLEGQRGGHYGGKIVNLIWETGTLTVFARTYDYVWETIDGDHAAQQLSGRTGEEIRAHIEANVLEEGIDAVFANEIRGNFGMHQRALAYTVAARQYGKVDEWLDGIFTYSGSNTAQTGLNYALYNLVYRDGLPYETSPGYNWSWVANITSVGDCLKLAGRDVYAIPKMKRLYEGVLDMHNARQFTPALGDSGSVYGGMVGCDGGVFQAAYRAYGDPRFLTHLAAFKATGEACFVSFESLFQPIIEAPAGEYPAQRSRLLDGYGMSVLNNAADNVSAAMYYGFRGGHGHFDRLHFDVFANGQPMMPDLGYPDFMNGYVSGIYTWSKNTINHNTVTVDAQRQLDNRAGTVHLFADGDFARVVDVDAAATYPQCQSYRRRMVMVDVDEANAYFIDIFNIEGGHQHDYSLHGPPGTFEVHGGEWDAQAQGTLAGADVPLGMIYDNPTLAAEDYQGTFYGYTGSGFQHLVNVRRLRQGTWHGEWRHEKDENARLRVRLLAPADAQFILAQAQVSPVKYKQLITYAIARRAGDEGLSSRFVSLIEPFGETPIIAEARLLGVDGDAVAVEVNLVDGRRDVVILGAPRAEKSVADAHVATDAACAAVRFVDGEAVSAFLADGTYLNAARCDIRAENRLDGTVTAVEPMKQAVRIRLEQVPVGFAPSSLAGRVVHFENDLHRTAHPVVSASLDGSDLVLTTRDDLLVGRAHLTGIEADALVTDTAFIFEPEYCGTSVTDAGFAGYHVISQVGDGRIRMATPLGEEHGLVEGQDVWLVNVGPGDRFEAPAVASLSKGVSQ